MSSISKQAELDWVLLPTSARSLDDCVAAETMPSMAFDADLKRQRPCRPVTPASDQSQRGGGLLAEAAAQEVRNAAANHPHAVS